MFYNPLGQARDEVVSLYTDSPSVEVKDSNDVTVMAQIDPVWAGRDEVSSTKFKVCSCVPCTDQEGGQGVRTHSPPPPVKSQKYRIF